MSRVRPIHAAWIAGRRLTDVVVPYQVAGPRGSAWGVLCLADADVPAGTEETDPAVVAALAGELARSPVLRSAALLMPAGGGDRLTAVVRAAVDGRAPISSIVDADGQRHRMWVVGPGTHRAAILAVAGERPLIVADGNHRTAAVREAGLPALLALVTAGPDLRIDPMHRELIGTGLTGSALASAWRQAGLDVDVTSSPDAPAVPGEVTAVAGEMALRVGLPAPGPGEPVPRIDHAAVEEVLLREALGLDPDGPAVRAVALPPGGPRDAVLLIAPVPFDDLLAVQRQGRRMPRKSSCFVPKPREGLMRARLDALPPADEETEEP